MRYPVSIAQYLQALRTAARDAAATGKVQDESRLSYLEAHAGPRRKGESRSDYETRHNLALATAPQSGRAHARLASDCRARVDVVSTLQGSCFVGTPAERARAARELVAVLRLDGGGLAVQAASELTQWAALVLATPAAKPRTREDNQRDHIDVDLKAYKTAPSPAKPPMPKINAAAAKAPAPAAKVGAVVSWLKQVWA